MPFDAIDFIPSSDVRTECRRLGKTFTVCEKLNIVRWSDRPMRDRIEAYFEIGKAVEEYLNGAGIRDWPGHGREFRDADAALLGVIRQTAAEMRRMLEEFPKSTEGFVFYSGREENITGFLSSCVSTSFDSALERCQRNQEPERRIKIVKAAVDREYYLAAFIERGAIIGIDEFSPEHRHSFDPERNFKSDSFYIPIPFKKGDAVCACAHPDAPMIFWEQDEWMNFKYLEENDRTGQFHAMWGWPCCDLMFYRDALPDGELQIIQKALRGECDFITAFHQIQSARCRQEMDELDEWLEEDRWRDRF